MVQGYYTLEEAADYLGLQQEELKQKARSKELRSFQDRGTLHFRIQDIQELARQRGLSSDPDLTLGEASLPPPTGPATPKIATSDAPDVFDFEFDAEPQADGGALFGPGSGPRKGAPKSGPKSGPKGAPKSGPRTPPKAEGSDSDVRLVPEGEGVDFTLGSDSNVRLAGKDNRPPPSGVKPPSSATKRPSKLGGPGSGAKPTSGAKPSSVVRPGSSSVRSTLGTPTTPGKTPKPGSVPQPPDSGVRLVPMDSDSDVRILGHTADEIDLNPPPPNPSSDSNVRLDRPTPATPPAEPMMLTEEINLDEELKKQEEAMKLQAKQPTRVKPKSELKLPPGGSPFELSESELDAPRLPPAAQPPKLADDSSDYDLVPAEDGRVAKPQLSATDDFSLELNEDDNAVVTGGSSDEVELTGPTSGIQLNKPTDAGISLEDGSDSLDSDLSLEPGATPRPGEVRGDESEFELNLDSGDRSEDTATSEFELINVDDALEGAGGAPTADTEQLGLGSSEFELSLDSAEGGTMLESDSEFELSLDSSEGQAPMGESDSEFELTLDDSGSVSSTGTPQVKAGEFDSDFSMPDLAESGEGSADAELESSDFDLALDDSELAAEGDESASQVVALDEEEVAVETVEGEESSEVVAEPEEGEAEVEVEDEAAEEEVEAEEETAVRGVARDAYLKPAPWGALPVVFMLPCVIVMVLVGLMGFELIQSGSGYKAPGTLTKAIGELIGQKIK